MKTSDLDSMEFKRDDHGRHLVKSGGKWITYGRVLSWCCVMGHFRKYGEWTVQETCSSAACRGTVRARISGPRGTVEAWNQHDVYFIPKGVKFSKLPYPECYAEDERNGIVWWKEPGIYDEGTEWVSDRGTFGFYREGKRLAEWERDRFAECVGKACAMAGLQESIWSLM